MKFYDVEQDAQEELIDSDDNTDTPIFDKFGILNLVILIITKNQHNTITI